MSQGNLPFRFRWIIQNYSFCFRESSLLSSPKFLIEGINDKKWYLELEPSGFNSEYTKLYLVSDSADDTEHFRFDFVLKAIGSSGKILGTMLCRNIKFETKKSWGGIIEIEEIGSDSKDNTNDELTVCCYLSKRQCGAKTPVGYGYMVQTRIFVSQLAFEWNLNLKPDQLIDLQKNIQILQVTDFEVSISEADKAVKIMIHLHNSNMKGHIVEIKFIILDGIFELYSEKAKHRFNCVPGTWEFPSLALSGELRNLKTKQQENNSLSLLVEFACSSGKESHSPTTIDTTTADAKTSHTSSIHTLENDLQNIFSTKKYCDIKIKVDNDIVTAHKAILAARSPVFSAMFHAFKKSEKSGIVDIADMDVDTLNLFLEYLYTDCVREMDYDKAKVLLLAAKKYQVFTLKEECLKFLKTDISIGNACEILTIAHEMNDIQLKAMAMNFVVANYTNILSTSQWKTWIQSNGELATTVFLKLSTKLADSSSVTKNQRKKRRIDE